MTGPMDPSECYGGIDLGGTFIKAGLLSSDGRQLAKFKIPTRVDQGIPAVKSNLRRAASILIEDASKKGFSLRGIGVGSPGTIRHPEGLVTGATPNIPGWIGTNISSIFEEFDVSFAADNDANCMGLAEAKFGAGKGTKSGFYLTLGTGVGGAIVMNGSLVRGASFCAGEFGHMVLRYGGKICRTGRRGCLEGYVAAPALIAAAKKAASRFPRTILRKRLHCLRPEDIFAAFRKNDKAAVTAVAENASMIGVAIGSVVNLLNPDVVVIGGGLSQGSARYIGLIRKSALAFAFESTTAVLKIKTAKFGNDAGWIGAACLHIEN